MSALGLGCVKNAKALERDRRTYSSMTVPALKLASAFNLEDELKNVILSCFDLSRFYPARTGARDLLRRQHHS
jgi:hypothetical protein